MARSVAERGLKETELIAQMLATLLISNSLCLNAAVEFGTPELFGESQPLLVPLVYKTTGMQEKNSRQRQPRSQLQAIETQESNTPQVLRRLPGAILA